MSDDVAISVDHVYKDFVLPQEKISSVKGLFTSAYKKRSKVKTKQHALKDISFEIKKGEFFGIVGRNGSGKSTLLKILAGIYQPTQGSIHTDGKLVPFIELGVGFNPELTGRENVFLNGAMLGFSEQEVAAMYDDIVSFAELERFMDQKLKNYSSGMQVRLAFSMATRSQADILLVDEVLAVGDADFQRKCFNYFKSLKKDKKTVIFVSHDMNAVREFCDRALLINDSRVVDSGTAAKISVQYTRLFAGKEVIADTEQVDANRWGDGAIRIVESALSETTPTDEVKNLILSMVIRPLHETSDVVAGFVIKNASGEQICGTNTKNERVELPKLVAGEDYKLTWHIPNIFADGKHTVDLAVHRKDGVTINDWHEDALRFTSKRIAPTSYVVAPPFTIKLP